MYLLYLWEVLKRAFTPAPRVTDMLQILAASALPATSKFIGIELPQNAAENALAYIGMAAVSFVVIRLFWAPYAIWREQNGEIGNLKVELSSPQRHELEKMADYRAHAKIELSGIINKMAVLALRKNAKRDSDALSRQLTFALELCGRANASRAFDVGIERFGHLCFNVMERRIDGDRGGEMLSTLINAMQSHLHGELTAEALALQLPTDIGPKTRQ